MSAKTPVFGDKVKIRVGIPEGQTAGPREPGIVGVVVQTGGAEDPAVGVMLEDWDSPLFFEPDEITTDLTWATPQEQAILDAFLEVLRKERVGEQHGKRMRVARALLQAYGEGLRLHDEREQNRIEQEADRVEPGPRPESADGRPLDEGP